VSVAIISKEQGLNDPFAIAERYLQEPRIPAIKICSRLLDACVWLAFDESFQPDPDEPLAVFYDHEIPILRDKTPEQLKRIHEIKLVFPGSRVRDHHDDDGMEQADK
jgi:hypothetical protein